MQPPAPLSTMPPVDGLKGILCDIDDTLTLHGRLPASAYAALEELQQAGLKVIPVTGRPGGWVDQIARIWPVDGVVGENGGLWFYMAQGKLQRRFLQDEEQRRQNQAELALLGEKILQAVPGCALASDQPYRELDLAIDFCEDVPALDNDAIDQIVALFEDAGAVCKVSSIHVNGWFGSFDKLTGCQHLATELLGASMNPDEWIYVGDSANDAPMFGAFPHSVGVANVRDFLPRMKHWPAFVTPSEGGHGFAELTRHLLDR